MLLLKQQQKMNRQEKGKKQYGKSTGMEIPKLSCGWLLEQAELCWVWHPGFWKLCSLPQFWTWVICIDHQSFVLQKVHILKMRRSPVSLRHIMTSKVLYLFIFFFLSGLMNSTVPQFLKHVTYLGLDDNRHQNNVTERNPWGKGFIFLWF